LKRSSRVWLTVGMDGVSGVGKSTLLEDVAIQLIRAGRPLVYMDPHGTSARRILNHIPKRYSERVVYINPLAKKVPGISVFCGTTKEEKELDIASLSSMLKSTAGERLGVRDRERHRRRREIVARKAL
jgi:hypothetical protein